MTRILVFGLVTTTLSALLHRYLWARLVRDAALPQPWQRAATIAIVVLAVVMSAAMPLSRALPRAYATPVSWIAFSWMGAMFLLLAFVAAGDLAKLGHAIASRAVQLAYAADSTLPADPGRRVALSRAVAGVAALGTLAGCGVGIRSVLGGATVTRVRVPIDGLPAGSSGISIAQITDLHVGPTIGREYVEEVVRRTNAIGADVIAITGDLVDGSVSELREHVAPLAGLQAPLGVYFVTGNHEYYSGVDAWIAELRRMGIRVLRNERVPLTKNGVTIDLAGIDDWSARQFGGDHGANLGKALAGRDPSRPVVLLAHQPRAIAEAADKGVSLVLSGHTHGGQLFPWQWAVRLQQPYVHGLHRHGDAQIYVSRGTGYWGPPMRIGAPSEIAHVQLVPRAA